MRNSNEISYESLFAIYRQRVYDQVYAMTRSAWHAEEIVQDVFLRVWLHRSKLSSIKDMESWLFIITKRFVFDYVRKEARNRNFYSSYKYSRALSSGPDSLLPLQCQRLIDEALSNLSPRERQVYHMKQIERKSRIEIAKDLNISEATAVHYIKQSMVKMRNLIYDRLEVKRA